MPLSAIQCVTWRDIWGLEVNWLTTTQCSLDRQGQVVVEANLPWKTAVGHWGSGWMYIKSLQTCLYHFERECVVADQAALLWEALQCVSVSCWEKCTQKSTASCLLHHCYMNMKFDGKKECSYSLKGRYVKYTMFHLCVDICVIVLIKVIIRIIIRVWSKQNIDRNSCSFPL